jgi:hypothetical protein
VEVCTREPLGSRDGPRLACGVGGIGPERFPGEMADAGEGGRAPGTASSRVSSEYNRLNRKSKVAGASRHATPPRAFGNPGGPPPGQPFRHTQVRGPHAAAVRGVTGAPP